MKNIQDFYILGLPIETDLGKVDFIKIRDYPEFFVDLQIIGWSKYEIIYKYSELNKDGSLDELLKELNKLNLYEIVLGLPELYQAYFNVFSKVFQNEEAMTLIDEKNFDFYRELIMKMNCVTEEEYSPNPEIQHAIERSKRVKAQERGKLTFSDMCSSIVAGSNISYHELLDLTVYQFYMTFYRIAQFKNYDTSTLFATVSTEKIDIESWSKHIDLYEKESHFITEDQFKRNTGSLFEQ